MIIIKINLSKFSCLCLSKSVSLCQYMDFPQPNFDLLQVVYNTLLVQYDFSASLVTVKCTIGKTVTFYLITCHTKYANFTCSVN